MQRGLDEAPRREGGGEGFAEGHLEGDAEVHAGVDGVEGGLRLGHDLASAPSEAEILVEHAGEVGISRTRTKKGTETRVVASLASGSPGLPATARTSVAPGSPARRVTSPAAPSSKRKASGREEAHVSGPATPLRRNESVVRPVSDRPAGSKARAAAVLGERSMRAEQGEGWRCFGARRARGREGDRGARGRWGRGRRLRGRGAGGNGEGGENERQAALVSDGGRRARLHWNEAALDRIVLLVRAARRRRSRKRGLPRDQDVGIVNDHGCGP